MKNLEQKTKTDLQESKESQGKIRISIQQVQKKIGEQENEIAKLVKQQEQLMIKKHESRHIIENIDVMSTLDE